MTNTIFKKKKLYFFMTFLTAYPKNEGQNLSH